MKGPHAYAPGTGRDAYGGGKLADDPRLLSVANIFRDPRSRVRRCVRRLDGALARHPESPESPGLRAVSGVAVAQFLAGRGAPRHCAPGEPCHVDSPMMRWNRRLFWLSTTIFVLAVTLTFGSELALQRS